MVNVFTKRILPIIPILIFAFQMAHTWWFLLSEDHKPMSEHFVALALFVVSCAAYFVNFKVAVIFTGVFIIIRAIGLAATTPELAMTSFFVVIGSQEYSTPGIQDWSFWLLIIYVACTWQIWRTILANKRIVK